MSRRVIIGAVIAVVLIAIVTLTLGDSSPTQVIGNLTPAEMRQIRAGVSKEMRVAIFTELSWSGLREAVRRFWDRLRTRILCMEKRTDGFVAVFTGTSDDWEAGRYRFWGVFRGTNGWIVGGDYGTGSRSNAAAE